MINRLYNEECFECMKRIEDKTVDMVLCDLPYGITKNDWDKPLDIQKLWSEYDRICKDNAVIVLTAVNPFSAQLIASNIKNFKYDLVWEKTAATNHLNAKRMPLRSHENILIFYKKPGTYNPQKTFGHKPTNKYTKNQNDGTNYGKTKIGISGGGSTERYPRSVLKFSSDKQKCSIHPTQKPLALFEWLIKTYSNENDLILDNCSGSATTAVACLKNNRNFICIEKDAYYHKKASERIKNLEDEI